MPRIDSHFPSGKQNFSIYIDYSYSQDINANQTRVDVTLGLHLNNSYGSQTFSSSGNSIITGWESRVERTGYDLRGYSAGDDIIMGSTSYSYTHSPDGTVGGIPISGSVDCSSTGQGVGRVSTTIYPPVIPRASSVVTHGFTAYANRDTGMSFHITSASSSFRHRVTLYLPDGSSIQTGIGYSCTGYTFFSYTFTQSQRDQILKSMPNSSRSGRLTTILTTYNESGGIVGTSEDWLEIQIDPASTAPTFTSFTYVDSNNTTVALTANNATLIKGYSNLLATVLSSNKATPSVGATMKKYILSCGNKTAEAAYSAAGNVTLSLSGVTDGEVKVIAVDSRGNQTTVSKSTALINYTPPAILSSAPIRDNNVSTQTKLTFSAKYWNGSFRSGLDNTVTASYRWKADNTGTWSSEFPLPLSESEENITGSSYLNGDQTPASAGFSSTSSYSIELTIRDKLAATAFTCILSAGLPVVDLYRSGATFGMGVGKTWQKGALDVNGEIYAGENGQFPALLVTASGSTSGGKESWIKLSSGLMLQWGKKSLTIQDNGGYVLNLPASFGNSNWSMTTTVVDDMDSKGKVANIGYTGNPATCNLWFSEGGIPLKSKSVTVSYIAIGTWS